MDIKLLKTSILQNNIPYFMAFVAEESALCKQYILNISSTLGKHYRYYDSADEVIYETSTNMKDDFIYIILNDQKIIKNPKYFEELSKINRHIILYFNEFDGKSEIYKKYSDYFVIFNKLDKYTILAYLLKILKDNKIEVDQNKLELLVDYCDCSLGKCLNELDKIIALGQASSNMVFDYMLENGFSDYRETDLFRFVQKVVNKNISAFDDASRLYDSVISVVVNLYKQARYKLLDKSAKHYVDVMKLSSMIDTGIKAGTINDKYALDYLLIKVL